MKLSELTLTAVEDLNHLGREAEQTFHDTSLPDAARREAQRTMVEAAVMSGRLEHRAEQLEKENL